MPFRKLPFRKRRPRVNRHYKIDHELKPADREAYLAYLREPPTTIDLAHAWLTERGYRSFSRSAVARHRRHYLEGFRERERLVDAAGHFARMAASGEYSADNVIAGLAVRHETLLARALFDLRDGGDLTLEQLNEVGDLVSRMVNTRAKLIELERAKQTVRPTPPVKLTPEEERREQVRKICDILGEPYPAERAGMAEPPKPPAPPGASEEPSNN